MSLPRPAPLVASPRVGGFLVVALIAALALTPRLTAAAPDPVILQLAAADPAVQAHAEAVLLAGGWPAQVALRRYQLFPSEPVRQAATRLSQTLGARVWPNYAAADMATLTAELRAQPGDLARWQPLWQQQRTAVLPLLLCLWQDRSTRAAATTGLRAGLEWLPAPALQAWLTRLPAPWRADAIALLDSVAAGDDWLAGNRLLDLWLALPDDRRAYETGRRLWLSWPAPGVLADTALAVQRSNLGPAVWAAAGARLARAEEPAAQAHELDFFLALAEAVGRPAVAPQLADTISLSADGRLAAVDRLLALKAFATALALLGTTDDPVARVQRGWAQAHTVNARISDDAWAQVIAKAQTQGDFARLAAWLAQQDHARAADAWRRAQQLPPRDSLAWADGQLYFAHEAEMQGDFAAAAQLAEAAMKVYDEHAQPHPEAPTWRANIGRWRAAAAAPDQDYWIADARARAALQRHDYAAALRCAQAAAVASPERPAACLLRFQVAAMAGDPETLAASAADLAAHLPAAGADRQEAVVALTANGWPASGETLAQSLLTATPAAPAATLLLALVRQQQGRLDEALALRLELRRLGGDSAELHRTLGELYAMQGAWPAAAASLAASVRQQPTQVYGRLFLHWVRRQLGQDDTADLAAFTRRLGGPASAWTTQLLRFANGELNGDALLAAARTAATPMEVRGQLCEAYFSVGQAALAQHDPAAARAAFTQCLAQQRPGFTEAQWARAALARLPAP